MGEFMCDGPKGVFPEECQTWECIDIDEFLHIGESVDTSGFLVNRVKIATVCAAPITDVIDEQVDARIAIDIRWRTVGFGDFGIDDGIKFVGKLLELETCGVFVCTEQKTGFEKVVSRSQLWGPEYGCSKSRWGIEPVES